MKREILIKYNKKGTNMKAEELIKNNALQNIEVAGKQKVVFEEIAITAVSMARIEEKERALQALQNVLAEWMPGSAKVILDDFKEELNHGRTL
jgi:hypothetical protein